MKSKWFLRVAAILGVCMASLLVATPAMAMWSWCDVDPVLNIEGHTVSLDALLQGDPTQIRGDIVFSVTIPEGTHVSVIFCEPNARVEINYDRTKCDEDKNHSKKSVNSHEIPVDVSVEINTKTTFNTKLVVTLDGKLILQEEGTTNHDLEANFTIK
jgi:hypothetical protein